MAGYRKEKHLKCHGYPWVMNMFSYEKITRHPDIWVHSQPPQNGYCDFATFFDISTKWFYPKNNI